GAGGRADLLCGREQTCVLYRVLPPRRPTQFHHVAQGLAVDLQLIQKTDRYERAIELEESERTSDLRQHILLESVMATRVASSNAVPQQRPVGMAARLVPGIVLCIVVTAAAMVLE